MDADCCAERRIAESEKALIPPHSPHGSGQTRFRA